MLCPSWGDMARTLSLTSMELPREVRCRLRAGPKSVVSVFCVFHFALFPLWVLGDWEPGILHGTLSAASIWGTHRSDSL